MEDIKTQTETNIKKDLEVRCSQCEKQITVRISPVTKVKQCDIVFTCPFCLAGNYINWKNVTNVATVN